MHLNYPFSRPRPLAAAAAVLTAVNRKLPLGFCLQDVDDNWLPVPDFLEKPVDLKMLPGRIEPLLDGQTGKKAEG